MFRFSTRDLFWATLVVALALGWFCHWRANSLRYERRSSYIEELKSSLRLHIGLANNYQHELRQLRPYFDYDFMDDGGGLPPELENEPR